jgi:hydrogenase expression/formation protein HypC
MCLAIPALIKRIDAPSVYVDMGGVEIRVSMLLTPEARVGEYVIVHAGFAITVMGRDEVEETLRILEEVVAGYEE